MVVKIHHKDCQPFSWANPMESVINILKPMFDHAIANFVYPGTSRYIPRAELY